VVCASEHPLRKGWDATVRLRHIIAILLMLTTVLIPGGPADASSDPVTDEATFVAMINDLRSSEGLTPLRLDPTLRTQARLWAREMADAGSLSHAPDLSPGITVDWDVLGENVGVHAIHDLEALFQAFVDSPGHYENLVDPRFEYVGVGVVYDSDGTIWTTHRFMSVRTGARPPAHEAPASITAAPAPAPPPSITARVPATPALPATPPTAAPTAPAPAQTPSDAHQATTVAGPDAVASSDSPRSTKLAEPPSSSGNRPTAPVATPEADQPPTGIGFSEPAAPTELSEVGDGTLSPSAPIGPSHDSGAAEDQAPSASFDATSSTDTDPGLVAVPVAGPLTLPPFDRQLRRDATVLVLAGLLPPNSEEVLRFGSLPPRRLIAAILSDLDS
jgi:hypothetical protein